MKNEQALDKQKWSLGQKEVESGGQELSKKSGTYKVQDGWGKGGMFRVREKFSVARV